MTTLTLDDAPIVKSAIIIDPKLWEALAPDREKFPFIRVATKTTEAIVCPGCGKPTRGRGVTEAEMPGTIVRCTTNGLCHWCWKTRPELRPVTEKGLDVVTVCPAPGCGKRTRSKYTTIEDHPGTIQRVNNTGICRQHYRLSKGHR